MKLVSLKKDSNINLAKEIEYYLNPDYVYIPAKKIKVKQNEHVYKKMEVCQDYVSPISGLAYGLKKCSFAGKSQNGLVIKNDFRELEKKDNKIRYKVTIKNILQVLEENKNIRLLEKFKNQNKFSNIVISAINDEPYIYNNIFILRENINELVELFDKLSYIYKSDFNYLVIKNIDNSIITDCLNLIGTYPNIKLTLINDEYLMEKEEFLLNKLELKNYETLYLTSLDLLIINNYLKNKDNSTVLLTISGDALEKSKVIRVKKYTMLKDILANYFNIIVNDYIVVANGLLRGYEIKDMNTFIVDNNVYSINIMKKNKIVTEECINCGKCIDICPMKVNPLTLQNKEKCIDCGLCSYICPGYVNLRAKLKGEIK